MNIMQRNKLHIGIDFDNTIVCYDNAFHHQAQKLGLIDKGLVRNKQVIRDAIRRLPGGNDRWTELQGIVYGLHMNEAELINGVDRFLLTCKEKKVRVSIVSHKSIYPAMGPRVNLQDAARKWLEEKKFITKFGLREEDIVFETTLEKKLDRIKDKRCTHFIDDLAEVLFHKDFPEGVEKILFSKTEECTKKGVLCFRDWNALKRYFFPTGKNDVRGAAVRILNRTTGEKIVSFRQMPGTFNCTAFEAVTDKKEKYMVKKYLVKKNDKRDRLATEFEGLSFLWKNGVRSIPRPVAIDRKEQIGIYSFIEGRRLRGEDIKLSDVMKAAKIIGQMRKLNNIKGSASQPVASEACFSIKAYVDLVEKRMERLKQAKRGVSMCKEMLMFVRLELEPFFERVKKFIIQNSTRAELGRALTGKEKFLSPSDVGFHNILKDRKGRIFFVDFEYYGWDDPAKTISDFFLQPDSPMPVKFRRDFFDKVAGYFGRDRRLVRRLPLVYAALSVKWCQIMLNMFLGEGNIHDRIVCAKQLKKAGRKLRQAARELKMFSFPISLVNEVN